VKTKCRVLFRGKETNPYVQFQEIMVKPGLNRGKSVKFSVSSIQLSGNSKPETEIEIKLKTLLDLPKSYYPS